MNRRLYSYHYEIYFAIPISLVMPSALKTAAFSANQLFSTVMEISDFFCQDMHWKPALDEKHTDIQSFQVFKTWKL